MFLKEREGASGWFVPGMFGDAVLWGLDRVNLTDIPDVTGIGYIKLNGLSFLLDNFQSPDEIGTYEYSGCFVDKELSGQ